MARLEKSIKEVMELFEEYANGDGKLSKEELMNLFDKEIQCKEMKEKIQSADFDKIMKKLDRNRDKEIDFGEFLLGLRFVAKRCYHKKTGRGQEDED